MGLGGHTRLTVRRLVVVGIIGSLPVDQVLSLPWLLLVYEQYQLFLPISGRGIVVAGLLKTLRALMWYWVGGAWSCFEDYWGQ